MKKNKKKIVIAGIAAAAVILTIVCIALFLSPKRTTIYTFKKAYSAGTKISMDMLTPIQVDSDMISAGTKTNVGKKFVTGDTIEDVLKSGDSLKVDVSEDMPLMTSCLAVTGGNAIEVSMDPAAVAVTVDVDDVTGVTNELAADSRVNVYVTYRSSGSSLLLENMRVLEVFKSESGDLTGVTIETDNEEAVKLIEASNNGDIHLGLVNGSGYQYALTENTDTAETTTATADTTAAAVQ